MTKKTMKYIGMLWIVLLLFTACRQDTTDEITPTETPTARLTIEASTAFDDTVAYKIILSLNPTVEFSVNSEDYVIEVVGLNEDGVQLIAGIDFYGLSLENATIVVVNQLMKFGYINASNVVNEIDLYFSENTGPLEALNVMSTVVEYAASQYDFDTTQEELNKQGLSLYYDQDNEDQQLFDAQSVYKLTFDFFLENYSGEQHVGDIYINPNDEVKFETFLDLAGADIKHALLQTFQKLYDMDYIRDDVELNYMIPNQDAEYMQELCDFINLLIAEKGLAVRAEVLGSDKIVASPTGIAIEKTDYRYSLSQLCDSGIIKNREDTAAIQMDILMQVYDEEQIEWLFTPRYWAVVPNFIGMEKDKAIWLAELTGFEVVLDEFIGQSFQYEAHQIGIVQYQDTNTGNTWEIGTRFQLSVLAQIDGIDTHVEMTPTPYEPGEMTPEVHYNPEGYFIDIVGENYSVNLKSIGVMDFTTRQDSPYYIENPASSEMLEIINSLYFGLNDSSSDGISGYERQYQVIIRINYDNYVLDIYKNDDGCRALLNETWKCTDSEMLQQILDICSAMTLEYSPQLSDVQIISMFVDRIQECRQLNPLAIEAGRTWMPSHEYWLTHYTSNGMDEEYVSTAHYQPVDISAQQFTEFIERLEMNYMVSSYHPAIVAADDAIVNSDLYIFASYDEQDMFLNVASDGQYIYMGSEFGGDYYTIKICLAESTKEFLNLLTIENGIYSFDDITNTESISIYYVENQYEKDYPENGKLTEVTITDTETIESIIDAVSNHSVAINTYPSRENWDMVFHTPDEDIYFKIKVPFECDDEQFEWMLTEATFIVKGYYWYSCPKLYEILYDLKQ